MPNIFLITTLVFGVTTIVLAAKLDATLRRLRRVFEETSGLHLKIFTLDLALMRHEAAEAKRQAQRIAASKAAAAKRQVRKETL